MCRALAPCATRQLRLLCGYAQRPVRRPCKSLVEDAFALVAADKRSCRVRMALDVNDLLRRTAFGARLPRPRLQPRGGGSGAGTVVGEGAAVGPARASASVTNIATGVRGQGALRSRPPPLA